LPFSSYLRKGGVKPRKAIPLSGKMRGEEGKEEGGKRHALKREKEKEEGDRGEGKKKKKEKKEKEKEKPLQYPPSPGGKGGKRGTKGEREKGSKTLLITDLGGEKRERAS